MCVRLSYVVAGGFGPDGVFSSQSNAAQCDDQQDAHLEVAQRADVVTRPTEPGCAWEQFLNSYICAVHATTNALCSKKWVFMKYILLDLRVGGGQNEHGAEGRHWPGSPFTSLIVVVVVLVLLGRQRLRVGIFID